MSGEGGLVEALAPLMGSGPAREAAAAVREWLAGEIEAERFEAYTPNGVLVVGYTHLRDRLGITGGGQ